MLKTTLTALIASSVMVSAVVIFSADADAGGKRRGSAFSAAPVKMKAESLMHRDQPAIYRDIRRASGQAGRPQLARQLDGGCLQHRGRRRLVESRRYGFLRRPGWKRRYDLACTRLKPDIGS